MRRGATTTFAEPSALVLMQETRRDAMGWQDAVVRLEFEGADPDVRLLGEQRLAGNRHDFFGNEPDRWRRFVPGYAQVAYKGLDAGVNLILREQGGQLEYDLLLEPLADLDAVVVRCQGIEALALEDDGTLRPDTAAGLLRQPAPETWWVNATGERQPVSCRYRLLGEGRYGFSVNGPRRELPLVIGPGLEWSTYFGGSFLDYVEDLVLDPSGAVTFTGDTQSVDLPVTAGAFDTVSNYTFSSPFVTRLSADGSALVFSTFLGGTGFAQPEVVLAVIVEPAGSILATGRANTPDFPTTTGAFATTSAGGQDVFISRLDATGSTLLASTLIGGTNTDTFRDMCLTPSGDVVIVVTAATFDFPITAGAFVSHAPGF